MLAIVFFLFFFFNEDVPADVLEYVLGKISGINCPTFFFCRKEKKTSEKKKAWTIVSV